MKYTYFILSTLVYCGVCKDCVLEKPPGSYLEKELVDALTQAYPIEQPPCTNNTDHVEVQVFYLIEAFYFDTNEEILTLYTWNIYEWKDYYTKWDVDKYNGLKYAHTDNLFIWSPMMKIINSAVQDPGLVELADCVLKHDGNVTYAQTMEQSIFCSSYLKNWPYDTKNCTLKFNGETWFDYEESKILFTVIDMFFDDRTSAGWTIIKGTETMNLTGEHQATIELILERKADCLEASIVIPAVVVSVLTVASVFLNIKDNVRLGMLCFSLLTHFLVCNEISIYIPRHGADTPVILFFVSHSTALTVFLLILTFFLRLWIKLKSTPPGIVLFVNSLVFNTRCKHLVVPRWYVEVLDENVHDSCDSTEWIKFWNIVNSVSLFVSVITYIILFANYMPQYTPDPHIFEIS